MTGAIRESGPTGSVDGAYVERWDEVTDMAQPNYKCSVIDRTYRID